MQVDSTSSPFAGVSERTNQPRIKMKIDKHVLKLAGELIEGRVGYFNGYAVSEESVNKSCQKAAGDVIRFLANCPDAVLQRTLYEQQCKVNREQREGSKSAE